MRLDKKDKILLAIFITTMLVMTFSVITGRLTIVHAAQPLSVHNPNICGCVTSHGSCPCYDNGWECNPYNPYAWWCTCTVDCFSSDALCCPPTLGMTNVEMYLNEISTLLNASNLHLIHPALVEQSETTQIIQMWQIALIAFVIGFLLVIIFAIVWSRTT